MAPFRHLSLSPEFVSFTDLLIIEWLVSVSASQKALQLPGS